MVARQARAGFSSRLNLARTSMSGLGSALRRSRHPWLRSSGTTPGREPCPDPPGVNATSLTGPEEGHRWNACAVRRAAIRRSRQRHANRQAAIAPSPSGRGDQESHQRLIAQKAPTRNTGIGHNVRGSRGGNLTERILPSERGKNSPARPSHLRVPAVPNDTL